MQNPYFNRTTEHFCSHAHAPNNTDEKFPAVIVKGNVAYVGWDIFTAYATHGHLCFKEIFSYLVKTLLGDNSSATADIPDKAVMTLTRQEAEGRSILHLLFAHTTLRGRNTEVIEDTVPLYNVECSVKTGKKPSSVRLVPEGTEIAFDFDGTAVHFTVNKVDIHQMIEIAD